MKLLLGSDFLNAYTPSTDRKVTYKVFWVVRYFGGLNTSCEELGPQNSYDKGIFKPVSLCVHSCQICYKSMCWSRQYGFNVVRTPNLKTLFIHAFTRIWTRDHPLRMRKSWRSNPLKCPYCVVVFFLPFFSLATFLCLSVCLSVSLFSLFLPSTGFFL